MSFARRWQRLAPLAATLLLRFVFPDIRFSKAEEGVFHLRSAAEVDAREAEAAQHMPTRSDIIAARTESFGVLVGRRDTLVERNDISRLVFVCWQHC